MKLLTWNINHGGSSKRISNIAQQIIKHSADLILITEYWSGEKGEKLQKYLRDDGYQYIVTSNGKSKQNHLLFASRYPFEILPSSYQNEKYGERWLEIKLHQKDLHVLGIHIPTSGQDQQGKLDFWMEVNGFARKNINHKAIILGDYNTGLAEDAQGAPFRGAEYMQELLDMGWIDAWRHTHGNFCGYSWYSSKGNGFRIDHAFGSPLLHEKILESYFSHQERMCKISDHSLLIVELAL
ncbi:endonuclease/exonuclease/phosphatase family protein [Bacillus sp. 179-C3.3 HS]|uniref:endonuclease/exonuclease/phosphatase family protein n=1 Tax=Bacillus sp. 179-C3.3 HS TaxID=3232162 RepID=UPI00399F2AA4